MRALYGQTKKNPKDFQNDATGNDS